MTLSRSWALHPGLHWAEALQRTRMSQAYAAPRLGVSVKHLNRILHGHALPSVALTIRFAELVGESPRLLWQMRCDYEFDVTLGAEDVTPTMENVIR